MVCTGYPVSLVQVALRHPVLNECVSRALQSAGVPSFLEQVGVDRGDGRIPDSITIFAERKCLCCDSIIHIQDDFLILQYFEKLK